MKKDVIYLWMPELLSGATNAMEMLFSPARFLLPGVMRQKLADSNDTRCNKKMLSSSRLIFARAAYHENGPV